MSTEIPIPTDPLAHLLSTLDLSAVEASGSGEDVFLGQSQWMPHGRVFGGQVLAQALADTTGRAGDEDDFAHVGLAQEAFDRGTAT